MTPTIALAQTGADIASCFSVMAQLRPHLVEAEFVARVRRMQRFEAHRFYFRERMHASAYHFVRSLKSWARSRPRVQRNDASASAIGTVCRLRSRK